MTLALTSVFRCPVIVRDLAIRACLRRQVTRKAVRDANGKVIVWERQEAIRRKLEQAEAEAKEARAALGIAG